MICAAAYNAPCRHHKITCSLDQLIEKDMRPVSLFIIHASFAFCLPSISDGRSLHTMQERQSDPPDPEDHSYITGFGALGDSYSAGIGAGSAYDIDVFCARYDAAFPALINSDVRMGDPATRTFQFLACSGAKTSDVLSDQIPRLGPNQNLITLSIGVNDVGLSDILNDCVFQWSSTPLSDCDKTLATAQMKIDEELPKNLDKVIAAIKRKLSTVSGSAGELYVAGYAHFFDDTTDDCDNQTWSFWYQLAAKQYLTKDRRQKMNQLVDNVNAKILAAVQAAGEQVVFVNYDPYVTFFNGRYCENGVNEPDGSRLGLFFYESFTVDPGEDNSIMKRSAPEVGVGTFGGDIVSNVNDMTKKKPDWTYANPGGAKDQTIGMNTSDGIINPIPQNSKSCGTGQLAHYCEGDTEDQLGLLQAGLPITWLRVFHPRPSLHALIANLILYLMAQRRAAFLNTPAGPEVASLTVCPAGETAPPN